MSRLVILKDSWHYRHYKTIKKIWDMPDRDARSLCTYVQVIFWASLLTLLTSPALLFGWIELKLNIWIYKNLNKTKWGQKIIDNMLDKLKYGNAIEELSKGLEECIALASLLSFVLWTFALFCLLVILYISQLGLVTLLLNIFKIPGIIWWLIISAGYGLFVMFAWVGWLLQTIWVLVHTVSIWVISNLDLIGKILAYITGSFLLVFVVIKFFASDMMSGFREFAVFRYNGFMDARKEAAGRPRPEKKAKKKVVVSESKPMVLSFFSVIWEFLKAVKKGICPMVDFVKSSEIQEANT